MPGDSAIDAPWLWPSCRNENARLGNEAGVFFRACSAFNAPYCRPAAVPMGSAAR